MRNRSLALLGVIAILAACQGGTPSGTPGATPEGTAGATPGGTTAASPPN